MNYFSTIASDIGGNHVISLTENEFNSHSSVQIKWSKPSIVTLNFNSNILIQKTYKICLKASILENLAVTLD